MTTVIKKNNNKRKGRKKTRKKTHVRRDLNLYPNITVLPQGLAWSAGALFGRANFFLAKAHVESRKEGRKWSKSKGAG